jgi:hypothetical protein
MKHPEYKKATNEYQGRNEGPRLSKEARLASKQRMIDFGKRLEEISNRKK